MIFETIAITPVSIVNLNQNKSLIIATICLIAIVLIIIYIVNLKMKLKLFIFYYIEYSPIESILYLITIFFVFDCFGLFHLGQFI